LRDEATDRLSREEGTDTTLTPFLSPRKPRSSWHALRLAPDPDSPHPGSVKAGGSFGLIEILPLFSFTSSAPAEFEKLGRPHGTHPRSKRAPASAASWFHRNDSRKHPPPDIGSGTLIRGY